ncbi:MAG TPA: phosphoglycerate dehydrogenase [Candidatus Omnitrophota bacterium]|nr:phosphoglycerate dehydrogenase [Candidatus Omnitrophota bacterium]HPD84998.1 phosphoglycerate dehydrogenase [Candidatus Omnitrophota bacterium]HRZ03856.1 phosphoglycerate dehydrogenase [Candidatus Omnitrophota bacterium]
MKILISDKLAEEGVKILKDVKDFQVDCKYGIKPDELKSIIKDYDALIIRSGTTVTADIIAAADKLKFIGRAGVGLDNVDLPAATKKGIVAMNTPAGNTTSTAEHTMSLILSMSRNIPQSHGALKAGKWERNKFMGVELYGKTLGIIGLGRIGSTVAKFARSFGMKILAFDPYISMEVAAKMEIEMAELDQIFRQADYITVHTPKSSETKHLISDKEFAIMKKGVRVVNCARGGIIDEAALARALEKGIVAGCALDVYEQEPPPADLPLLKFENCVVTPHLGASTSEAQVNVAIEIANTIRDALLGKGIVNAANFPTVDAASYKVLGPYINLAERMGKFAGQLVNGRVNEIEIVYSGAITGYKLAPVTMSLVYGLLWPIVGETVNFINALELAKERAIKVQEIISSEEEEFVNLINLKIKTDKETFSLWGTLSGNKQPRIVKVNSVYVEAFPGGYMLFVNNNDRPGIVGAVGTVLAQENINVAGITFGRETPGGMAISVVNVDTEVPERAIEKLRKTKDILFVKLIKV